MSEVIARVFAASDRFRQLRAFLLKQARTYLPHKEVETVDRAFLLAAKLHAPQVRKSGEPYLLHPLAVANLALKWRMDGPSIVAALLHDTVEDCGVSVEFITERFGGAVGGLVDALTKIDALPRQNMPDTRRIESLHKLILALSKDARALILKIADRIHNLETLEHLPREKRVRVAKETQMVYIPLVNQLGLERLAHEMSALSFRHLYPRREEVIRHHLERIYEQVQGRLAIAEQVIHAALTRQGIQFRMERRQKTPSSAYFKLLRVFKKRGVEQPFSLRDMMDLHAFRIITESLSDCYLSLGVVHQLYRPIPGRFKDYIALPKSNGYQSIHTVVLSDDIGPMEIQIRTSAMHRYLSYGIASHWIYKTQGLQGIKPQKWLRNLSRFVDDSGMTLTHMAQLQIDQTGDEVMVLTPGGDVHTLVKGATILDFAYAIHTDLGEHAVSGLVDNRPVPLNHRLQNGETVRVVTQPDRTPEPKQLNYAVTPLALLRINQFLRRTQEYDRASIGRQALRSALKIVGENLKMRQVEPLLSDVLPKLKLPSLEALYTQIGEGKVLPLAVLNDIKDQLPLKNAEGGLFLAGSEPPVGLIVQYDSVCMPLPGDPIIAASNGNRLTIHKEDCPNHRLWRRQPQRYFSLSWSGSPQGPFLSAILLQIPLFSYTQDLVSRAAEIIRAQGGQAHEIRWVLSEASLKELRLFLYVRNLEHLHCIMRSLWKEMGGPRIRRISNLQDKVE